MVRCCYDPGAVGVGNSNPIVEEVSERVSAVMAERAIEACADKLQDFLQGLGFERLGGQFLRTSTVHQVIELQHAIYGPRITVNLGLDLPFLLPVLRWLPRNRMGPCAHECFRWLRIGYAGSKGGQDRWWTYALDRELSIEQTASALVDTVEGVALDWFASQSSGLAFRSHAEQALQRSINRQQPEGGYLELRQWAAVLAWNQEGAAARAASRRASSMWPEERRRLELARSAYAQRHAQQELRAVPALQDELEDLVERLLRD